MYWISLTITRCSLGWTEYSVVLLNIHWCRQKSMAGMQMALQLDRIPITITKYSFSLLDSRWIDGMFLDSMQFWGGARRMHG